MDEINSSQPSAPAPVPTPPPAPTPGNPAPAPSGGGFKWDEQKTNISIWCLVAGIAGSFIDSIGGFFSAKYFASSILSAVDPTGILGAAAEAYTPPLGFNFNDAISNGIVAGVVMAVVLMFFYRQIFAWAQRQFFGKYVNTFFKILFYPSFVAAAVLLLLGGFFSFKATLVMVVFALASRFVFAKILDLRLGQYFR